jgi:hypothetical protein
MTTPTLPAPALHMRGIPAAGLREGDGEAGSGETEHAAEREGLIEAVDAAAPSDGEAGHDDELGEDAGGLGADAVDEHA